MAIVLMYHDVYRRKPAESGFKSKGANHYKLNYNLFREHLALIKRVAPDTILTFDDGGISFFSEIAPCLEEFGFRGHFYVATDYIGTDTFLTYDQIADLHRRGHVIGSHSSTHPENLNTLTLEQRKEEWKRSIDVLSNITHSCVKEVSIPNGYYQTEDIQLLSDLGITTIYTSTLSDDKQVGSVLIRGRIALVENTSTKRLNQYLTNSLLTIQIIVRQKLLRIAKYVLGEKYLSLKRKIRKIKKKNNKYYND